MDSAKKQKFEEETFDPEVTENKKCEDVPSVNTEKMTEDEKHETEELAEQEKSSDEPETMIVGETINVDEIPSETLQNNFPVIEHLSSLSQSFLDDEESLIDRILEEMNSCVVGLVFEDEIMM